MTKAFKLYMKEARQDYGKAQNAVGNCYYHGGTEQNISEAFARYLKNRKAWKFICTK